MIPAIPDSPLTLVSRIPTRMSQRPLPRGYATTMYTLAHTSGAAPSLLLDLPATSLSQSQRNNYIKDTVKLKTNPLAMAPPNTTCMLPPSPCQ